MGGLLWGAAVERGGGGGGIGVAGTVVSEGMGVVVCIRCF